MIVDPSTLETYRSIMDDEADEFIADILTHFYINSQTLIAKLDDSLAENNREEFVRAAHTFKSTSATVGAQRVSNLLANLEERGETELLFALQPLIPELKIAYEESVSKLKELYP